MTSGEGAAEHLLPIDPDIDVDEEARGGRAHFRASVVASVFIGGCVGGLVRYEVTDRWPTPDDRFPWPTFTVNVVGAFILAVLVVIVAEVLRGSTYFRPLVGAGFCGALTTFSSVVVEADEQIAHGQAGLAVTYLVTSIVAGLFVAWVGFRLAHAYVAAWGAGAGDS